LSSRPDVPYVPTPQTVVEKMLESARVGPEDVVYDLGAGDGRIVITAVKKFNAKKAVGVEKNEERVRMALENIKKEGVEGRATIIKGDFFDVDLSEATVVTMFLLANVNELLKPKLEKELRPGTRVVSHEFEIRGWKPKEVIKVREEGGFGGITHIVYLYVIGEHK
jgi:precorrin-6B methylase 2